MEFLNYLFAIGALIIACIALYIAFEIMDVRDKWKKTAIELDKRISELEKDGKRK